MNEGFPQPSQSIESDKVVIRDRLLTEVAEIKRQLEENAKNTRSMIEKAGRRKHLLFSDPNIKTQDDRRSALIKELENRRKEYFDFFGEQIPENE